jgi:hypothetical protein
MHSGAPFAKKGGADLSLPSMDIPISLLNWEVFLPERYKVKDFGGDVIASNLVPAAVRDDVVARDDRTRDAELYSRSRGAMVAAPVPSGPVPAGQMGGYVTDPSGAVVPNVQITVTSSDNGSIRSTVTDSSGRWAVLGLPSGNYKVRADSSGFRSSVNNIRYNAEEPSMFGLSLQVGTVSETVEVTGEAPMINTESAEISTTYSNRNAGMNGRNYNQPLKLAPGAVSQNASVNVVNLQKRVSGVLPVAIDVPRAGTSFSFVRPLVLDEETKVTFSYKSR